MDICPGAAFLGHVATNRCYNVIVCCDQGVDWQEVVAEVLGVQLQLATQGGHLRPAADKSHGQVQVPECR